MTNLTRRPLLGSQFGKRAATSLGAVCVAVAVIVSVVPRGAANRRTREWTGTVVGFDRMTFLKNMTFHPYTDYAVVRLEAGAYVLVCYETDWVACGFPEAARRAGARIKFRGARDRRGDTVWGEIVRPRVPDNYGRLVEERRFAQYSGATEHIADDRRLSFIRVSQRDLRLVDVRPGDSPPN